MSIGNKGRARMLGALGYLCWSAGGAAMAEAPGLAGVRLGAHDSQTRVVLDVTAAEPNVSYSLSPDGMILEIKLKSRPGKPAIPARHAGLVRDVSTIDAGGTTDIVVATGAPVALVGTGTLKPSGAYRHHRIYFDLAASSAPPAPVPAPVLAARTETPVAARSEPVTMAAAEAEAPHGPAEAHRQAGHVGEHEETEPLLTVKIGGAAERSLKDYTTSAGPTFGLETGLFHDALEVELNSTPLMQGGKTTWKSGLILKKPFELSESVEFELGLGPIWLHRGKLEEDEEVQADSLGGEAVAELVFWPFAHKSLGFYVEGGYSYDFGKGHEKAAGGGAGLLISIP